MNGKVIPVYVLTGFLGSGKTTLLNRILEDLKGKGLKPAILLNEVGDVNVEGQLVEQDIPMAEVLGGCICCTSRGDLGLELVQLAQDQPDVIWIESTGVAQPLDIMDGVTEASLYAKLELKNVVTVVDGRHLLDRLRIGTGKTFKLMKEQIRAANILVLNKTDLVREDDILELRDALTDWNPHARIVLTSRSNLDPAILYAEYRNIRHNIQHIEAHVHNELCQLEHGHEHHHDHDRSALHDHVNVVTYFFKGNVDSVAFESFLKGLPDEIYRAKGIVTFQDTASLFLFQYAYREIDFLRITPQKSVNNVAVFIGEGFSESELLNQLEQLDSKFERKEKANLMKCVRVVTNEQLNQAFDIRVEVFVKEQGVPRELEMDEYDESPESCHHFIVLKDELPIAAGRWKPFEDGVAKMQRIAVLKPFRGMGAGMFLLRGMEEDAKQSGYGASVLDAQCTAETFYSKLGYVTESEEPFLDANIMHVRMRKSL